MVKGMGTARLGLFAKNKKQPRIVLLFVLFLFATFASIFSPLLTKNTFATASGDLVLYDARTSHRKVTDEKKTVTITAYIAGPETSSGSWPDIKEEDILVFGEGGTLNGDYGFSVDWVRQVPAEDDPHYGMYEVKARGRPKYLGSSPYNYDITFCALTEGESEAHCATKNFNTASSVSPSNETVSFSITVSDVTKIGYPEPGAEADDAEKTCRTENAILSVIFCPVVDLLSEGMSTLYEATVSKWLNISPELFNHGTGEAGETTFEAWETARNLANLLLVIMIIMVIISQITGYGVSNYGIKKYLPKVLVAGVLVNLSYYVCQGAIDLSNILGNGLGSFIENASNDLHVASNYHEVGGLLSVVVAVVVLVVACALNPALIIVLIGVLLSGILAVFILAITLGVRQAAAVVLVIVSPVAIICYSIPGLKSVYDKWFKYFWAVLIAYPISSLVVYGGAFGSKILLITWGGESFFSTIAAFSVGVVPFFMLPKIIRQTLGSLTTVTTKLQNNISGRASRMYNNSGLKKYVGNEVERKKMQRLAGVRRDRHGNLKRTTMSKILPFSAQRSEFMRQAMNYERSHAEHKLMQQDGDYFADRQFAQKISNYGKELDALNLTPEQLGARMDQVASAMDTMTNDGMIRDNQAMIAAIAGRMAKSNTGRVHMEQLLSSSQFSGSPTLSTGSIRAMQGMSMGMSAKDFGVMDHTNPYLSSYMRAIKTNGTPPSTYADFHMDAGMLKRMGAEDWGKLSAGTRDRMIADATNDPNSAAASAFNNYMEEVANNAERNNQAGVESLNTESDAHIEDALRYINQRNSDIASGAASLIAAGQTSGDMSGAYDDDLKFLANSFMDASERGDLMGMESAHKALLDRAHQEQSTKTGADGEQFWGEFSALMGSIYDTVTAESYSGNFHSMGGTDTRSDQEVRAAATQQIALFRSRLQGKNG